MQLLTAAQWFARAQEARELAPNLTDAGARATMLAIAEGYDKLGRHAAAWTPAFLPEQAQDD